MVLPVMSQDTNSDSITNQVILATGGYDHSIRFWHAHNAVCHKTCQHPESQVNALDITPDKKLLAAAGYQHIRMYDIESNNPSPVMNYDGISKNITAIGFQEKGRWMFTGGEDSSAKIWDLRARPFQCQRIFQTNNPVTSVYLHPNQSELYVGDQGGILYVWDLRTDNNEQVIVDTDISVQYVNIDVEGRYMAIIDNKGNCYIYSLPFGQDGHISHPCRKLKLLAHKRYGLKCKFSPDSTLLVTTSADTTAKIWRTADLQVLMDRERVNSDVSSDGNNQLSIQHGWKTIETEPLLELKNTNQRWVWDIAFSADSQYCITASSDNVARLWSTQTGSVIREYIGHQKALTALAFSDSNHVSS